MDKIEFPEVKGFAFWGRLSNSIMLPVLVGSISDEFSICNNIRIFSIMCSVFNPCGLLNACKPHFIFYIKRTQLDAIILIKLICEYLEPCFCIPWNVSRVILNSACFIIEGLRDDIGRSEKLVRCCREFGQSLSIVGRL
jgi:hypothetical protein